MMNAWNKIGQYYSDRQKWAKAAQYYTQVWSGGSGCKRLLFHSIGMQSPS